MQNSLSNFEETSSELNKSSQIISDDEVGLITSLLKLKNSIDKVSNNSQKFNLISQRISSIKIDLEDISSEIDNFLDSLEQNPEKLNKIINKIDIINNLFRKHSLNSIKELSVFRDNLALKVNTTKNIDNEIQLLQTVCEDLNLKLYN